MDKFSSQFNVSKLRILAAIDTLNMDKIPANSVNISELTGIDLNSIKVRLCQLKKLLNIRYDNQKHDNCKLLYSLNTKGQTRLDNLLKRVENGNNLKLKKKPEPYDWTGFVLLPGLKEPIDKNK